MIPSSSDFSVVIDGSKYDQTHHTDAVAACVDFTYRESIWVLQERHVTPTT